MIVNAPQKSSDYPFSNIFSQEKQLLDIVLNPLQIASFLLIGDISVLLCSLQIASTLRADAWVNILSPLTWMFVTIYVGSLYLGDTYRPTLNVSGLRAPVRALLGLLAACGLWIIVTYIGGMRGEEAVLSKGIWPDAVLIFSVWLSISRMWGAKRLRDQASSNDWLLLGFNRDHDDYLADFDALNLTRNIFALLEDGQLAPKNIPDTNVDSLNCLDDWLSRPWNGILLGHNLNLSDLQMKSLKQTRLLGVSVYRLSDLYEKHCEKIPANTLQDTWFTFSAGFHLLSSRIGLRIKRFGDICLAAFMLVLVFPLMLLTAIAIKLDSPGPVFYDQVRTGQNMTTFNVHKFRSMSQDAENQGVQWASKQDSRITRVGRFIRLVRIDELPQLWNVLRGDMSMIGPRPERPEFDRQLTKEIPHYAVRYMVKPGITGWAQVRYPYGASVKDSYEKLSYDLYYIKNYSLWLDIAIVFKTVRIVLLGKGR